MQTLANISQFETLQSNANAAMGHARLTAFNVQFWRDGEQIKASSDYDIEADEERNLLSFTAAKRGEDADSLMRQISKIERDFKIVDKQLGERETGLQHGLDLVKEQREAERQETKKQYVPKKEGLAALGVETISEYEFLDDPKYVIAD